MIDNHTTDIARMQGDVLALLWTLSFYGFSILGALLWLQARRLRARRDRLGTTSRTKQATIIPFPTHDQRDQVTEKEKESDGEAA